MIVLTAGFRFFGIARGSHHVKPAPENHDRADRRGQHENEIDHFRYDSLIGAIKGFGR